MAKDIRSLSRYNESTEQTEIFYPATTTDAVAHPTKRKSLTNVISDIEASIDIYDVSAKNPTAGPNNDGKWESLSALLSDASLNTLIPTSVRKGGMSIKFVLSVDNKYVQYRLMLSSFSVAQFAMPVNWQGVDNKIAQNSKNLIESGAVELMRLNEDAVLQEIIPTVNRPKFNHGYIVTGNGAAIGDTISLNVVYSNNWVCTVLDCQEGETITIQGAGATLSSGAAQLWVIVDADNKIVAKCTSTSYTTKTKITCPPNSAKFIFNTQINSVYCCYKGDSSLEDMQDEIDSVSTDLTNLSDNLAEINDNVIKLTQILPSTDRLSENDVVVDNMVGDWKLRYSSGNNTVVKNADNSFRVSLDNSAGSNPAFWLLNVLPQSVIGKKVIIKAYLKRVSNGPLYLVGFSGHIIWQNLSNEFKEYKWEIDSYTNSYADRRLMFYAQNAFTFDVKDVSFEIKENAFDAIDSLQSEVDDMQEDIVDMQDEINSILSENTDIDTPLRNFLYKIACIERETNTQAVIGLLGDSWTQHSWSAGAPSHGEEGSYLHHSNYVQPLTKYLRTKYGDAGGGYYSFSESHIGAGDTKMMSADYDDAWDERSLNNSGLITYRDQSEGCKGIDAADATFHEGAYLTLHVTTPQSVFVIHFFGDSNAGQFTYTLDSGSPVTVDASQYDGYSTIEVTATDATHTLRFDCTSGSVMIFGVDMQRTNAGVRVHKIGNKGATSSSFVIVDADSWKAGIDALGLDSMTMLFGTNDGGGAGATIKSNLKTIANRVKSVNAYIDLQIIQPSNDESKNLEPQVPYQRSAAKDIGAGFINLIPLFGSVEQIIDKGTCVGVHPTLNGGYMIFEHLVKRLNLFKL